jgi:hypothetical protein
MRYRMIIGLSTLLLAACVREPQPAVKAATLQAAIAPQVGEKRVQDEDNI